MLWSLLLACVGSVPAVSVEHPAPMEAVDLSSPGPIRHTAVVSARWTVPLSGLLDLSDPKTAHLEDGPQDIVLPVHVLEHPEHGLFVIDTGVARELPIGPPLTWLADPVDVVEPLADIVARVGEGAELQGVFLTHAHLDHVLGLPDAPVHVPVYAGPGEEQARGFDGRLMFGTVRRALGDRPLTTWGFADAPALGAVEHAVDVFGDGSLYALWVPGHTPGSTAYLARTAEGPVLFAGDCSHTHFGWDNDVIPGNFTEDPEGNRESLAALRALAAEVGARVEVGHEE